VSSARRRDCPPSSPAPARRKEAAPGSGLSGRIARRGQLPVGYHGDPEATARVLQGGWLSTGDLGSVDAAGRVVLGGRIKELIIRAGANIYPAEVERRLLAHPDVAEAYVLGLPHAVLGEQVAACVVRRPGAAVSDRELVQFCRAGLVAYKCPERIVFVEGVTKTSRGKVHRARLQALFA